MVYNKCSLSEFLWLRVWHSFVGLWLVASHGGCGQNLGQGFSHREAPPGRSRFRDHSHCSSQGSLPCWWWLEESILPRYVGLKQGRLHATGPLASIAASKGENQRAGNREAILVAESQKLLNNIYKSDRWRKELPQIFILWLHEKKISFAIFS